MTGTVSMAKSTKQSGPVTAARLMREVRKAESSEFDRKRANIKDAVLDVGTGQTILKLRQKAIPKLVDEGKIGPEELAAAAEILIAFNAIASRLMCRGISYERVDNGGGSPDTSWPAKIAKPVERYQAYASAWTRRNEDYGDPTLEIVIDAVIDELHLSAIHAKHGCRLAKIEKALICGLRDYAARAGFITGHKAQAWQDEAAAVFGAAWHAAGSAHQGPAELRKAIRRAAVEK